VQAETSRVLATGRNQWTAEYPFHATSEPIYEYACHEGNYALPGILAGAREDEKKDGSVSVAGG
jgi:hypothetical protein